MSDQCGRTLKVTTASTTEKLDRQAKEIEALAELAMDHAKAKGADGVKVSTSISFEKRLVVENREFTLANSLESRRIGLVVHKDSKKGSATINVIDEASVKKAVEDALSLASFSVADEYLSLASAGEGAKAPDLPFLYDEELAGLDLPVLQGHLAEVLGLLTRDERVALDRAESSVSVSWHGFSNSNGVKQCDRQTMADWFFFGMARSGEEVTGFDYDGSFSYDAKSLLEKALADANKFTQKVVSQLRPKPCPSYKGPVLFSPRAVQELLVGPILYHSSGRQVMDGRSRFAEKIGEQVVDSNVTLRDQPHSQAFSGATSYDGDGVATSNQTVVEAGRLSRLLLDCYSAKRLGKRSNGMAGGPFALSLDPGKDTMGDLLDRTKHLLVVDRFSGNSDPNKGDFSGVAKGSRLYRGPTSSEPVTETMIAGNVLDLLQNVIGLGKDVENVGGGFAAPYVLLDGVSVSSNS